MNKPVVSKTESSLDVLTNIAICSIALLIDADKAFVVFLGVISYYFVSAAYIWALGPLGDAFLLSRTKKGYLTLSYIGILVLMIAIASAGFAVLKNRWYVFLAVYPAFALFRTEWSLGKFGRSYHQNKLKDTELKRNMI